MSPGSPWCKAAGPAMGQTPWMTQISGAYRCHSVGDNAGNLWDHQMIVPRSQSSVPVHAYWKIPDGVLFGRLTTYFIQGHKFYRYSIYLNRGRLTTYFIQGHKFYKYSIYLNRGRLTTYFIQGHKFYKYSIYLKRDENLFLIHFLENGSLPYNHAWG
jgi:hypothetical protein